jgi:pimeloyl-ACP methyl ester carboxylesterase
VPVGRPVRGDVVLVPGLGVAGYLWLVAQALAGCGWRAWLLRPPGWAGAVAGDSCSMKELGTATAGWLTELERPVVLVGQSVGTQIAAHAAEQVPGLVTMLLLQGPTVDPAYRSVSRLVTRWLLAAPQEPPRLARSQVPEWWDIGPRRLLGLMRACLDDDLEKTLGRLRAVPVRVVLGEHDRLCSRSWASSLSPAPMAILEGGHAACAADPEVFAALLSRLVEDIT